MLRQVYSYSDVMNLFFVFMFIFLDDGIPCSHYILCVVSDRHLKVLFVFKESLN